MLGDRIHATEIRALLRRDPPHIRREALDPTDLVCLAVWDDPQAAPPSSPSSRGVKIRFDLTDQERREPSAPLQGDTR